MAMPVTLTGTAPKGSPYQAAKCLSDLDQRVVTLQGGGGKCIALLGHHRFCLLGVADTGVSARH